MSHDTMKLVKLDNPFSYSKVTAMWGYQVSLQIAVTLQIFENIIYWGQNNTKYNSVESLM